MHQTFIIDVAWLERQTDSVVVSPITLIRQKPWTLSLEPLAILKPVLPKEVAHDVFQSGQEIAATFLCLPVACAQLQPVRRTDSLKQGLETDNQHRCAVCAMFDLQEARVHLATMFFLLGDGALFVEPGPCWSTTASRGRRRTRRTACACSSKTQTL